MGHPTTVTRVLRQQLVQAGNDGSVWEEREIGLTVCSLEPVLAPEQPQFFPIVISQMVVGRPAAAEPDYPLERPAQGRWLTMPQDAA